MTSSMTGNTASWETSSQYHQSLFLDTLSAYKGYWSTLPIVPQYEVTSAFQWSSIISSVNLRLVRSLLPQPRSPSIFATQPHLAIVGVDNPRYYYIRSRKAPSTCSSYALASSLSPEHDRLAGTRNLHCCNSFVYCYS
jgi:hypothetical protein